MSDTPDRVIHFERCFNFRDIGGYAGLDGRAVQWRRLFRSMTPQYMSERDAQAAGRLGLNLVIDFRGDRHPSSGPLATEGVTRLALGAPMAQASDPENERFRLARPEDALPKLLDAYGPHYAHALTALANWSQARALFHCRLGKDRTGVFAALVLKLLGVSDDDVMQDYMLTEEHEPNCRRLLVEVETDDGLPARQPLVAKQPASRRAIENVLQRLVSQYGGAYGYFARFGVSSARLDAFVETRLEARDLLSRKSSGPGRSPDH